MRSDEWFRGTLHARHSFDVIYLDGCHVDLHVMDDAVNSWWLLKPGGIMVFDDYDSRPSDEHHVRHAVNAFMRIYGHYTEVIFCNYQYGIRKLMDVKW